MPRAASKLDQVQTVSTRLFGRDRHALRGLLNDWQFALDDLSLSESEVFNAAVRLIVQLHTPDLLSKRFAEKGMSETDIEQAMHIVQWVYDWYTDLLVEVIEHREKTDKRRTRKFAGHAHPEDTRVSLDAEGKE